MRITITHYFLSLCLLWVLSLQGLSTIIQSLPYIFHIQSNFWFTLLAIIVGAIHGTMTYVLWRVAANVYEGKKN